MMYLASINVPGYLPMMDDAAEFDTVREAWEYLADQREADEESMCPDGGEWSETVGELRQMQDPGAVWGPTPGCAGSHDLGLTYEVMQCGDEAS